MKLLSGNSNRPLSQAIAEYLDMPLTRAQVRRFADLEVFVTIDENVRGEDVFVIQSTSYPANDNLMELLICIDALKRASGKRITAVIPYFGYARQDRKTGGRTPISAKLVANLITRSGADRVLTMDLHAGQIQGFFDIPTDNLFASPVMVRDIKERFDLANLMVVSPDVGGVVRARALAKRLDDVELAIIDKRRPRPNESKVMNIIGEVKGKTCILIDDMVDTAGTLCHAAKALKERLERTGRFQVVLTRETDTFVPLESRVQIARRADADLFISLHADSGPDATTRGASVYTLSEKGADRVGRVLEKDDWLMKANLPGRDRAVSQILLDLSQRATKNRSATFAQLLLANVGEETALLRRSQPAVRAEFHEGAAPDILTDLAEGRLDLVIGRPTEARHRALFDVEPLALEDLWAFCAADHPLAGLLDALR